jgi:acetyltransferase-like isoleucine patch superfamily enzyme
MKRDMISNGSHPREHTDQAAARVTPVMVPTTDVNSETAIVTVWHVSDRSLVEAGDLLAEVETSKAVVDVTAPAAGYVLHGAREGDEIRLSAAIAYLFESSEALHDHAARLAVADAEAAGVVDGPRATAPAIRRAKELGVELGSVAAAELITVKMVEAAARDRPGARIPPDLPVPLTAPPGVERVALIGAGLGATQVIGIFDGSSQKAVAIVDDDRARWGGEVAGVPVVGGTQQLRELHAEGSFDSAVVCIGTSVPARTRLREICGELEIRMTNAIDRTAVIAADVELGQGNVICAFCHFGVGTRIGDNNFLSANNSFDHHNVLGNDIATGPGCMTSGVVTIGDRARFGTGIFIEPHVTIGEDVQVASGAVIVSSVPAKHAVKRRVATTSVVPIRRVGKR